MARPTRTGRTSTKRKVRKSEIAGQFAWQLIEMLESPAFRVLSRAGHQIINRLEIELGHHAGTGNGSLICLYDDFQRYGIHRHAIWPAIQECAALGFIEVTVLGRAGVGDFRKPTQFRLTFRPTDHGDATDEWRRIKTPDQASAIAKAARKTGRHKNKKPVTESVPKTSGGIRTEKANSPVAESVLLQPAESVPLSISTVAGAE